MSKVVIDTDWFNKLEKIHDQHGDAYVTLRDVIRIINQGQAEERAKKAKETEEPKEEVKATASPQEEPITKEPQPFRQRPKTTSKGGSHKGGGKS